MDLSERHREVLRALASTSAPMPHAAIVAAVQAVTPQRHEDSIRNARMALEPWLLRRVGEKRATAYELTDEGRAAVTGDQAQGPPVAATGGRHRSITGDHHRSAGAPCRARRVSSKSNNDSNERTAAAASEPERSPVITGDHHRWRPVVSRLTRLLTKVVRENEDKDALIAELRAQLVGVSPGKSALQIGPEPSKDAAPVVHAALTEPSALSRTPTAEQTQEAIDWRVEQQRSKGFKTSEAAFRKHMKRELAKNPREVFEILDEKREALRVAEERSRAAKQEAKERAEESASLRPTSSDSERRERIRELDAGLLKLSSDERTDIGERAEALARESGVTPNSFKWAGKVAECAREIFEKEYGLKREPAGATP